jgi:hypothetical protein
MRLPGEERPRLLRVGQAPTADSALATLLERFEIVGLPVPPVELLRSVQVTLGLRVADLLSRVEKLEARVRRLAVEGGPAACG